jgi:CHAT domain-containing protein
VNPEISHLLVATAAGSDGALTTTEIATMNLHHLNTVVATGCRTATPSQGYGYVRSISSAFLAAGTKNVVASLWDVEDRAGSEFSIALHRALRSGVDPAEAMQTVQLQMMRSPDPRFNRLAAWAAMQLYAAGH